MGKVPEATTPKSWSQDGYGIGFYPDGTPCLWVWENGPVGQHGSIRPINGAPLTEDAVRRIVREEIAAALASAE